MERIGGWQDYANNLRRALPGYFGDPPPGTSMTPSRITAILEARFRSERMMRLGIPILETQYRQRRAGRIYFGSLIGGMLPFPRGPLATTTREWRAQA